MAHIYADRQQEEWNKKLLKWNVARFKKNYKKVTNGKEETNQSYAQNAKR